MAYGQGRGGRPWRRLRARILARDCYMCQCPKCNGMGKLAVAEFVEDEQTLQLLQGMGVDMVQGYHLDKPRADHPGLHGDGRAGIAPA